MLMGLDEEEYNEYFENEKVLYYMYQFRFKQKIFLILCIIDVFIIKNKKKKNIWEDVVE